MSFLAGLVQPADPAVEQKRLQETRDTLRGYKAEIVKKKNEIMLIQTKSQIDSQDAKLLLDLIATIHTYVNDPKTETLNKQDIIIKWTDTFNEDKFEALARAAIDKGAYPKSYGIRRNFQLMLKTMKQALHDNDKLKPDTKRQVTELRDAYKKFLDENIYGIQPIYEAFQNKIQSDYFTSANPNMADLKIVVDRTNKKILAAKGELDFEEYPGAPTAKASAALTATKQAALKADAQKDSFSIGRLFSTALSTGLTIAVILCIVLILFLGSSLAVNLNMYKPTPIKALYAVYGFLFGWVVLPYVFLYRWAWLGKKPQYYGFMPFVDGFFVKPWVQFLLGWLTYKTDSSIDQLKEWRN